MEFWDILISGTVLHQDIEPTQIVVEAKEIVGWAWCVHPIHRGRKRAVMFFGGVYQGNMMWTAPRFIGGLCEEHVNTMMSLLETQGRRQLNGGS